MKQVRAGGGNQAVQDVFSNTINKLGVNKQGEFSASRWLSDYDGWAEEGKNAFFRNVKGGNDLRIASDKFRAAVKQLGEYEQGIKAGNRDGGFIREVAGQVASKAGASINNPGFALVGSVATGSPIPALANAAVRSGNALVNRATRKMFTNPEGIKFLTRSVNGESDKSVIRAMKNFVRSARDEPAKAIIREYLAGIGESV